MGATLRYAKVVDADRYQRQGAEVRPSTDSIVRLPKDGPATALPFLVLRAWDLIDSGGIGETWQIRGPGGEVVREAGERTVLADQGPITDELDDVEFPYAGEGYVLVLSIEGREVARADFPVEVDTTSGWLAE